MKKWRWSIYTQMCADMKKWRPRTGHNSARIYRPSFHENKPNTLVFSHTKRAFWACFRENWVYNFGPRTHSEVTQRKRNVMAGWLSIRESISSLTQNKGNFSVCTVNVDTPEDQLQSYRYAAC
jgi:hypothetical protein